MDLAKKTHAATLVLTASLSLFLSAALDLFGALHYSADTLFYGALTFFVVMNVTLIMRQAFSYQPRHAKTSH